MDAEKIEDRKAEAEVLFPDVSVYGIVVRPWTFNQFVGLFPVFRRISQTFAEQGTTWKRFHEIVSEDHISELLEALTPFLPFVPEIVAGTIGGSAKDSDNWEFDKTISVFLMILIQNAGRIKNFFGLGLEAMKSLTTAN